jgi:hypothetical protein
MKFGLWFPPAVAIGAVGTLLAASLPVPPPLPSVRGWVEPARPTQIAGAPEPLTPALPATPSARAIEPPKHAAATAIVARSPGSSSLSRRAARRLARTTPDHHARAAAHPVGPHFGAIVAAPPPGPYPGMPPREPTQIAMAPPPYGMPAPYWRTPYRPY